MEFQLNLLDFKHTRGHGATACIVRFSSAPTNFKLCSARELEPVEHRAFVVTLALGLRWGLVRCRQIQVFNAREFEAVDNSVLVRGLVQLPQYSTRAISKPLPPMGRFQRNPALPQPGAAATGGAGPGAKPKPQPIRTPQPKPTPQLPPIPGAKKSLYKSAPTFPLK